MKRILSEVLRQKNGGEQRNRRAGALRIEFIERSRNASLGIEWFFAADCAVWSGGTGRMEDEWGASSVENAGAGWVRKKFGLVRERPGTVFC